MRLYTLLPLLIPLAAQLGGCTLPSANRLATAAENAISHPLTWGGAGGAALFALDGNRYDRKLSNWARTETPVFGSQQKALEASDRMREIADGGAIATALLLPSQWFLGSDSILLQAASTSLTLNTTGILKRSTERTRPNGAAVADSFPSAHSSTAFNYATLGSRAVYDLAIPAWSQHALSAGFYTLAAGTAWARVEGGVHYPSDVLMGAALGNFFAIFIYDGFIHQVATAASAGPPPLSIAPNGNGGAELRYTLRF